MAKENNSQESGTFSEKNGLRDSNEDTVTPDISDQSENNEEDYEAIFEQAYGKASGKEKEAEETRPDSEDDSSATDGSDDTEDGHKPEEDRKTQNEDETGEGEADPDSPYAWVDDIKDPEVKQRVYDEIRSKIDFQHRFNSDRGRIRAYQQQLADTQKRLSKGAGPSNGARQGSDASQSNTADTSPPQSAAEWEAYIENDPQLAKAVESRLSQLENKLFSSLNEFTTDSVAPLYQHNLDRMKERESDMLHQQVPNVAEVIQSPQYVWWLNNYASPQTRETALTSPYHQDAVEVLRAYSNDMVALNLVNNQKQGDKAQETGESSSNSNSDKADKQARARDQRLNSSPGKLPSTQQSPGVVKDSSSMSESDAEQLFKQAYKKASSR